MVGEERYCSSSGIYYFIDTYNEAFPPHCAFYWEEEVEDYKLMFEDPDVDEYTL